MPDMTDNSDAPKIPMPAAHRVERAIRLTYAQVMLNAIFSASTGGMFLIGFAISLGANDIWLGLMNTIPALFVVFQFLASYCVERGVSRKIMTVIFSFVTPACWLFIASIPFFGPSMSTAGRMLTLIGVIAMVTLAGQMTGNARSSWVGELIPESRRGRFFGYSLMFGGIIGSVFAITEGKFLDMISRHGLLAFTSLFFFGCLFGLTSACLNLPQPDCPLPGAHLRTPFFRVVRQTFANRPFVRLALVHLVVAMGSIAGPFHAAYLLRDVGLSYFQLGLLNSTATLAMLVSSGFWGRLVDRFGCRPVLIVGLAMMAPCSIVWAFIPPGAVTEACWLLPFSNFIAGTGIAAFSVAVSTGMYKLSNPHRRSVQFAAYSVFVTLLSAPMPALGGWLVTSLQHAHLSVDLRLTFVLWSVFMFLAAALALPLREKGALLTRSLVMVYFPAVLDRSVRQAASAVGDLFRAVVRLGWEEPDDPADPNRDKDRR